MQPFAVDKYENCGCCYMSFSYQQRSDNDLARSLDRRRASLDRRVVGCRRRVLRARVHAGGGRVGVLRGGRRVAVP